MKRPPSTFLTSGVGVGVGFGFGFGVVCFTTAFLGVNLRALAEPLTVAIWVFCCSSSDFWGTAAANFELRLSQEKSPLKSFALFKMSFREAAAFSWASFAMLSAWNSFVDAFFTSSLSFLAASSVSRALSAAISASSAFAFATASAYAFLRPSSRMALKKEQA